MNELKSVKQSDVMWGHWFTEYYLKSEADKVIAEKDNELRRHKYKRCLAMAYVEWLRQMILCDHPESILYRMAARREYKWKEMAQKFKEAK